MKKAFLNFQNGGMRRAFSLLCVFLCSLCLFAQGKKVTGRVTDMAGEPIIGANVVEKGTTNGVITDLDGNFMLNVSSEAILQFTCLDYL